MKNWLKERFSEPSSFAALGGALTFVGLMTKDNNLPVIAEAVTGNAESLASGDYATAILNIGAALAFGLGFIKAEKPK